MYRSTFLNRMKTDLSCSCIHYDHYSSSDYHLYDDTTKGLLGDRSRITALVPNLTLSLHRMRLIYSRYCASLNEANLVNEWMYEPLLDDFIRTWKATPEGNRKEFEEECKRSTAAIQKV